MAFMAEKQKRANETAQVASWEATVLSEPARSEPFHLLICKLKKNILHGLPIPKPNFSEFALFGEKDLQITNC
jgi:hypothetical protein